MWHTHLIGNSLHASYFTRRNKDRLTVLDLLRGGPRTYRFDRLTQRLLRELHMPQKWRRRAGELPPDRDLSEEELRTLLDAWAPPPPLEYWEALREAAAIASYRARPDHVRILISDDAKQFRHLADESALCWIHEGRHYKELYLYDRISGAMRLPSLANLIRARPPPNAASQPAVSNPSLASTKRSWKPLS